MTTSVSSYVADNRFNAGDNLKVQFVRIKSASRENRRQFGCKRKGAVLVLTWQFVTFLVYNFALNGLDDYHWRTYAYAAFIVIPISGWIADSYAGRYRVIKFCFKLMWLISLALSMTYLVTYLKGRDEYPVKQIRIGVLFLLHIFMGCSHVNIIQFTMDQLQDAPSTDIITYIKWLSWSFFASVSVATVLQLCTCSHYQAVVSLVPFGMLSYVLCSDFLFNEMLTKEPAMKNALRQIFGVLKFSATKNHPLLLSSYAYWNKNSLSSRINLAKVMHGGPFSNEEVEDVKTFFRIIIIFIFPAIALTANLSSEVLVNDMIRSSLTCSNISSCFSNQLRLKSGYLFIAVCIPIWENLVKPIFRKHLPDLKILVRMAIGGCCVVLSMLVTLSLKIWNQVQQNNADNTTCTYNTAPSLSCDQMFLCWHILPSILNCLGMYLGMGAGIEFICAQCPCTMKGIVYGLLYFFLGIGFTAISNINSIKVKYFGATISSVTFFLVINISIVLLFGVISVVGICCYKARKREDVSHALLGP